MLNWLLGLLLNVSDLLGRVAREIGPPPAGRGRRWLPELEELGVRVVPATVVYRWNGQNPQAADNVAANWQVLQGNNWVQATATPDSDDEVRFESIPTVNAKFTNSVNWGMLKMEKVGFKLDITGDITLHSGGSMTAGEINRIQSGNIDLVGGTF